MRRADVLSRLEALVRAEPGTLHGPEALEELGGWDSLCNVEFRRMVEEETGVQIDGVAVEKCATVDDLLDLLGDVIEDGP